MKKKSSDMIWKKYKSALSLKHPFIMRLILALMSLKLTTWFPNQR